MEHPANFFGVSYQNCGLLLGDDLNPRPDEKLRLQFGARRVRSPEMLDIRRR